jgi:hypothetical protein
MTKDDYVTAYYVWVTNDEDNTGEDKVWDVEGVYSRESDAESCRLSLLLAKQYKEVVIVPGPMKIK